MKNKIVVIHHSADFDGLFCREIARKFLPKAELIGWDFGDKPLDLASYAPPTQIYILDLPVDRVFGLQFRDGWIYKDGEQVQPIDRWASNNIIWIDHHKSSIETHPKDIPGYRIDGVAACRLAWVWFTQMESCRERGVEMPFKSDYVDRKVWEPYAVQLAGEYDIWDKRNPDAETFQFGLRSVELTPYHWEALLDPTVSKELRGIGMEVTESENLSRALLSNGKLLQRYQQQTDAGVVNFRSFRVEFEGLKFLALNTARCNSLTFAAKDVPETGHDALMGFYWNGTAWNVSLYHAKHRTELDLSQIAVKFGGGGHRGACGFRSLLLPFFTDTRALPQSTDARVWAKDWLHTIGVNPAIPTDEGTMITWFAGALMAGYDEARRRCGRS